MTRTQLMYQQHLETQRHNRAQEMADSEKNRINEEQNIRGDKTTRDHYERQDEINRTHYTNMDTETNRHNVATEDETNRHNVETENIDRNYKTMHGISYGADAASKVKGMMSQTPTMDTTTTTTTVAGGPTHGKHGQQVNTTTTTKSTTIKGQSTTAPAPGRNNTTGKVTGFINDLGPFVGLMVPRQSNTPVVTQEMVNKYKEIYEKRKKK